MDIFVAGGGGQLGRELAELGTGLVIAPSSQELDVTDAAAVRAAVAEFAARAEHGVVLNAAAYTAVDDAETNVAQAFRVNEAGPRNLAVACHFAQLPLIHVSTDYVFAGDGQRPYKPRDLTEPTTIYGKSKLAGEKAVRAVLPTATIVRTAWVYGQYGANFVETMRRLESERDMVSVVHDQIGSPTWARDLAVGLLELAGSGTGKGAILHATGSGQTSWYDFARAIFIELGADPDRVLPCTSAEFVRSAPRPAFSVLSNKDWSELGLTPLPEWRSALHEYLH
jgi:dTDP-4-dehydrorhamnose reductase